MMPAHWRKAPLQERAQRTVEAIFEATAQVLNELGAERLTTNRIAERAGCSIGTLYQYFPNKHAIAQAWMSRERERVMTEVRVLLEHAVRQGAPPRQAIAQALRVLADAFGAGAPGDGRRALMRLAWQADTHEDWAHALHQVAQRNAALVVRLAEPRLRAPHPAMLFVVSRAVMGVIRAVALEDSPWAGTEALHAEMERLVWGLLRDDGSQ